jgi:SAM-dependent methyltransferase
MSHFGRAILTARILADRLRGKAVFESPYYRESELARLANLFAHVDVGRWKGMKVLEVGAGFGRFGDAFHHLGFDVTSSDGRTEYVERMTARGRRAFRLDLEQVMPQDLAGYDLVIAFGVLYHLENPARLLDACGRSAKVLLLETAVSDKLEPTLNPLPEATGWFGPDQALSGTGCRPSPSWVEATVREAGFAQVRDISSPIANWVVGAFDWEPRNSGESRRDGVNLRKMWICEKAPAPTESRG